MKLFKPKKDMVISYRNDLVLDLSKEGFIKAIRKMKKEERKKFKIFPIYIHKIIPAWMKEERNEKSKRT